MIQISLSKTKAIPLINGGRLYPTESEKNLFLNILIGFHKLKKRSLTQSQVIEYLQSNNFAKARNSIELGLYKLGMQGYFKLMQKGRARIWYLTTKAKKHQKAILKRPENATAST